MFIKEIEIFSFGCLENKHFVFSDGFNLIYGLNESGKTTLFAFIKFAFYGNKFKKEPNEPSFKQRYMPLSGKPMAGRVVFEDSTGCTYILERFFGGSKNDVSLYNADTSCEIKDTSVLNAVGEHFFGVSSESFSKTIFLSAFSAAVNGEKSGELIAKLSNIFESGSDEVSYRQISDIIKNEISILSSTKRKNAVIPEIESDIQKCGIKLYEVENTLKNANQLSHDIDTDIQKLNELTKYADKLNVQTANDEQSYANINHVKSFGVKAIAMLSLFAVFAGLLSLYDSFFALIFVLVALGDIALILSFGLYLRKRSKNLLDKKDFTINEFNDKIDMINKQIETLRIDIAVKKERQNSSETVRSEYEEMKKHMSSLKKELLLQNKKLSALNLALKALDCAYDDIKSVFSPELSKRSGDMLAKLTNGKYSSLLIDDNFSANVKGEYGYIGASMLSRGTVEQIYLAVRLALIELVFFDKAIPVFMDDAFAFYDASRLNAALELMYSVSYERQVFFSTCRYEEYKLLTQKQINIIEFERND